MWIWGPSIYNLSQTFKHKEILLIRSKVYSRKHWCSKINCIISSQADANGTVPLRSAGQLRRKKRVTRMVAIVILLFAWCWLPIQFFTLWYKFDPNFPQILALLKFKIFAHTLSYANSCVNPFVYAFMNEGVRKAFKKKFPSASIFCHCFKKPKMTNPETSTMIDKAVMTTRGGGVESMATTHCSLWFIHV